MIASKKILLITLLASVIFYAVLSLAAAQTKSCVSTNCPAQNNTKTQTGNTRSFSRNLKLRQKYSDDLEVLKEIHEMQKYFLSQYNGKTSKATQTERDVLKSKLEELPGYMKKSKDLFMDRMDSMEYIIYDIISGKEKYKNKKKIKDPEKLLEEIQSKQRTYIMQRQKRELKKSTAAQKKDQKS